MNILLDTCTWFWMMYESKKLSEAAKKSIIDAPSVYVSAISFWEIALKKSTTATPFPSNKELIQSTKEHGIEILPLTEFDINAFEQLPKIHKDPFDRVLISQCIENGLCFLTPDEKIQQYPVKNIW